MKPAIIRPTQGIFRCTACGSEWERELPSLYAWFWYDVEDWPSCCDLPAWLIEPMIEPTRA